MYQVRLFDVVCRRLPLNLHNFVVVSNFKKPIKPIRAHFPGNKHLKNAKIRKSIFWPHWDRISLNNFHVAQSNFMTIGHVPEATNQRSYRVEHVGVHVLPIAVPFDRSTLIQWCAWWLQRVDGVVPFILLRFADVVARAFSIRAVGSSIVAIEQIASWCHAIRSAFSPVRSNGPKVLSPPSLAWYEWKLLTTLGRSVARWNVATVKIE